MRVLVVLLGFICCSPILWGQGVEPFYQWPLDLRIDGRVVISDGTGDTSQLGEVIGERGTRQRVCILTELDVDKEKLLSCATVFSESSDYRVVRRDPTREFTQLSALLTSCDTFLWLSESRPSESAWQQLKSCGDQLKSFVDGGGTLVLCGPMAHVAGAWFVDRSADRVIVRHGLGLLPDCMLGFGCGLRACDEMSSELVQYKTSVGVAVDEGTFLTLGGRVLSATGPGRVTVLLAGDSKEDTTRQTIRRRRSRRQSGNEYLIDLTQWRRRAINSLLDPFPPSDPEPPSVEGGTLVIVGGGGMPRGLMARFVDLAGGKERAKLVYVPCSEQKLIEGVPSTVRQWKQMGVRDATFIHTKDRQRANSDEEFLQPLKDATGIWFGGGRQWNFADSYYGTRAQALMQEVVRRGGVVGGSSAGASVQARFLARATPIENYRILAPGYLRGGLGFISGVAIDQHFTQRGRQKDMTQLVNRYPQMLGIGIDESTALVVHRSVAEVVGRGDVYFYDRRQPIEEDGTDYTRIGAGGAFDLAERKVLRMGKKKSDDDTATNRPDTSTEAPQ